MGIEEDIVKKELSELAEIQKVLEGLGFTMTVEVEDDETLAIILDPVGWAFVLSFELPKRVSVETFLKTLKDAVAEKESNLDLIERGKW